MSELWNLVQFFRTLGDVALDAALVWLVVVCGNAVRALVRRWLVPEGR